MEDYKKLAEELNGVAAEIRSLADITEPLNTEQRSKWETLNTKADELEERLSRMKKAHETDSRAKLLAAEFPIDLQKEQRTAENEISGGLPGTQSEIRAKAVNGWLRRQAGATVSDEEMRACMASGIDPNAKELTLECRSGAEYAQMQREARAQSAVNGGQGGYLTGTDQSMMGQIEVARLLFGSVRQVAEIIRTTTGSPLPWPTVDDTSNTGAAIGENSGANTTDISVGQQTWYAHKQTSNFVKVPFELFRDSMVNLESFIGSLLGERLGRREETLFTTGTGAGEPYGIVNGSVAGKTTASATAVTFDEIYDLINSVDPAYQVNAGFMLHSGILNAVRKLKDGQGQYLWQPSSQMGMPSMLAGFPYYRNQSMQSTLATGTKTFLFGDLSKYKIREVGTVRLRRLDERFADNDQVGFIAFTEIDGKILNAGTNPIKHMLQA